MIRFYFDFISPYSYIASALIARRQELGSLPWDPRPVVLGTILSHRGVKAPGEIPERRRAALTDALLLCKRYGVPFEGPPSHPFNSLWALRSVAALESPADRLRALIAYFDAAWAGGRRIDDPSTLREILSGLGIDQEVEEVGTSREMRQRTKSLTREAIELGVFGVPTFAVEDVLFFGHDRLELLSEFHRGQVSLDREKLAELLAR
ncbi:MAG: DsbA family protein [Deltaproteobacteria bacterium]|nr:DsbA family protein [Deltaproteobacteria bacterium]